MIKDFLWTKNNIGMLLYNKVQNTIYFEVRAIFFDLWKILNLFSGKNKVYLSSKSSTALLKPFLLAFYKILLILHEESATYLILILASMLLISVKITKIKHIEIKRNQTVSLHYVTSLPQMKLNHQNCILLQQHNLHFHIFFLCAFLYFG